MGIEYLENCEEPVEMVHEHRCDQCNTILIEFCSDDCDRDTFEVCQSCGEELDGDLTNIMELDNSEEDMPEPELPKEE